MAVSSIPIEVFFSYSHRDEELRNELEDHLTNLRRQGVITGWHDRKIAAGNVWAEQIDEHLNNAQIILLLVSASFLASDYCYAKELMRAMERHERGEARVIPVILRACDWEGAPFGKLQALPRDAKPVKSWIDEDEAFADVARGIRRAASELARTSPQPARGSASETVSETPKPKSISTQAHRFTGTVTIDGKPAPDGTEVRVWSHLEPSHYPRAWNRLSDLMKLVKTKVKDWRYRLEVPNSLFALPIGPFELNFRIDDLLVADQTADWRPGGATELNLTAKSTPTYRKAHRFTGTVTIGGKPAPDGTRVSVWAPQELDELRLVTSTSIVHGRYRLLVVEPYDGASIVALLTVKRLTFKIDDLLVADQMANWRAGGDTHLDLTAEVFKP